MPDARQRIAEILDRYHLDPEHPPEVMEEAAALAASPGIDDSRLRELGHLPFVTIDEVHSRDLDQALFVERAGDGHVAWYAIADAAWYLRLGTALFTEALRRGASYYLPGAVVPMLPRVLSEDLISLNPDVDRRALVFRLVLDGEGWCTASELIPGRVRSVAKLAYEHVQAFYDDGPPAGVAPLFDRPGVPESLRCLREVGERRLRLSDEAGVVRYRRAELVVRLDEEETRFVAWMDPRHAVERYGEQLSLLCNEAGARFLRAGAAEDTVQPIYRVHPAPGPERIDRLQEQIGAITRSQGLDPQAWRWAPDEETLSAFLGDLPGDGPQARVARAIHRQAMLSSGRASFRALPGVHFGVGAEVYARFSAPMREIVGVFLHKQVADALRGAEIPVVAGAPGDDALREQVVDAANRASMLQKKLDRLANEAVLDQLFGEDLLAPPAARPRRRGTVMGMGHGKIHVQLDDPPIDVKVYASHLERQRGERLLVSRDETRLVRRQDGSTALRVGDAVSLVARGHDERLQRWEVACEPA